MDGLLVLMRWIGREKIGALGWLEVGGGGVLSYW
jgi:hypothetical protein